MLRNMHMWKGLKLVTTKAWLPSFVSLFQTRSSVWKPWVAWKAMESMEFAAYMPKVATVHMLHMNKRNVEQSVFVTGCVPWPRRCSQAPRKSHLPISWWSHHGRCGSIAFCITRCMHPASISTVQCNCRALSSSSQTQSHSHDSPGWPLHGTDGAGLLLQSYFAARYVNLLSPPHPPQRCALFTSIWRLSTGGGTHLLTWSAKAYAAADQSIRNNTSIQQHSHQDHNTIVNSYSITLPNFSTCMSKSHTA